jgi:hypothetical protein
MSSHRLAQELKDAGYNHISIEALKAYRDGEVKLSIHAAREYHAFMANAAKMFAPRSTDEGTL